VESPTRTLHPTLNLLLVIGYIVLVGTVAGLIVAWAAKVPRDVAIGAGIGAMLLLGVVKWPVWLFRLVFRQEPVHPEPPAPAAIEVRRYRGRDPEAAMRGYRRDAERLAPLGYVPVAQSWAPGGRGIGDLVVAAILSLTVIGLLAWIWVLFVPRDGALIVTWQRVGA
jgi:hypothetical protein